MSRQKNYFGLNDPLKLLDHGRPKTRREFIAQGFMTGAATVAGGSLFSLFADPQKAYADLSGDLEALRAGCNITDGAGKIPFICFDLAGGANTAGSNVLVGQAGGQEDFLSTAGYSKQGLPGDMVPQAANPDDPTANSFVDDRLGLLFHSDSQMLEGIAEKTTTAIGNINGAVIAARSENDTGNNPHNPMYAINQAGANGDILALVGSRSSVSGGNSMAPMSMINPEVQPTKVDRASDATGLVDTGSLVGLLSQEDTVAVMEAAFRLSRSKLSNVDTGLTTDAIVKELVECGYVKSAHIADRFGSLNLDPVADPDIVGPAGIFSTDEYNGDSEFRKTASIMKLVMNGHAGAGTITMGGYDYHTGDRATGEQRDLRAGRCIGACLEYAARLNRPLMVYVFSDGSVFSNGMTDDSEQGRGKGVWTGDNQQTAAPFFLVYDPNNQPTVLNQQIGYMRASGDVETTSSPAANNVNLLVETVALNYMALHGDTFDTAFPDHSLGNSDQLDSLTAFGPIVTGTINVT